MTILNVASASIYYLRITEITISFLKSFLKVINIFHFQIILFGSVSDDDDDWSR